MTDAEVHSACVDFSTRLERSYADVIRKGGSGRDPAVRFRPEFEKFIEDVISVFEIRETGPLEGRIEVILSFLGDDECYRWMSQRRFNPRLRPVVEEIAGLLNTEILNDKELRETRVPEVVLAYLIGWRCCPESSIPFAVARARKLLNDSILGSIESSREWFGNHLWNWQRHESLSDARLPEQIVRELLNSPVPCICCRPFFALANSAPEKLKGNALRTYQACLENHRLNSWNPGWAQTEKGKRKISLWCFLQKAVLGDAGAFKPGAFRSGLLHSMLREKHGFELRRQNVAVRECPICTVDRRGTVRRSGKPVASVAWSAKLERCERCGHQLEPFPVLSKPMLTTSDAPLVRKLVFECQCRNHYEAKNCVDRAACEGEQHHDCCPRDRIQHPQGRKWNLKVLYFLEDGDGTTSEEALTPDSLPYELPESFLTTPKEDLPSAVREIAKVFWNCYCLKYAPDYCRLLPVGEKAGDWKGIREIVARSTRECPSDWQELRDCWTQYRPEIIETLHEEIATKEREAALQNRAQSREGY